MQLTKLERVQSRFIPAGYTEYRRDGPSVVYASADHLHAIAYNGTSRKAVWYYRFLNEAGFLDRVDRFFASMKGHIDQVEKRRTERREFTTALKPGDILHTSWGYDQTNVDFYQVIQVCGKSTIIIREIASTLKETEGGFMQGTRTALKDQFLKDEPELKKRVNAFQGREYVRMTSYSSAYLWDGKPEFCSWYG